LLTVKEILKQLRNENVYLGKNPIRTFALYEEKGLLPEPEGFRKNEPLYPENTPWVIKNILFAQQVEKRTVEDIRREQRSGAEMRSEALICLGLEDEPLNFCINHVHHGKYRSKDSDVLVAVYNTEIVIFLVEGLWGGFFHSPHSELEKLRVLKKVTLTLEEYGEYAKYQAVRRLTGEGKLSEETYLFETLFG